MSAFYVQATSSGNGGALGSSRHGGFSVMTGPLAL